MSRLESHHSSLRKKMTMTYTHIRRSAVCWLTLWTLYSSTTLFSSMAMASTTADLDRLEALIQQQDQPAAWQLANELMPEQEGDPRFDYLFALAARASGHLHQAVFALERALSSQPQSSDIRLALAISYFELGNSPAAERELKLLTQTPLPDRAVTLVKNYLQRIDKLRNPEKGYWQNWIQLGTGGDSNPNSGVDDELFFVPLLGQVRLFEQSLKHPSAFTEVQGQLNWVLPRDQHSAFYLSASVLHGEYADDAVYSRTYAGLLAGYQTRWQDYRLSTELFYRPIQLDGRRYLNYQGVKASVSYPVWSIAELGLDLTYAHQSYEELTSLDNKQWLTDWWLSARFGRAEHKVHLKWGMEDSQQSRTNFNSRDYIGLGYRWQQMLSDNWMSSLSLDYLNGEYDQQHPLFEEVRDDSYRRAELEVSYRFNPQWRILATINHMRNDSNIAIYQYRRTRAMLGVRYAF
jgi:outer membrane protein